MFENLVSGFKRAAGAVWTSCKRHTRLIVGGVTAGAAALKASVARATASVPDPTDLLDQADTSITRVTVTIAAVVAFFIVIAIVKWVRKK